MHETLQATSADTVGSLLARAAQALEPGTPSARLDAELLLSACTGVVRAALLAFPERRVSGDDAACFAAAVARRARGEPVAYITGEKEFYSLALEVTPEVLVPRAETELLVDAALDHLDARPGRRVLDLGTGSGAVALAIKRQRPHADVTGADCDAAALAVARANARRLEVDVRFVESHWLDAFGGQSFDLIVANPPYVPSGDAHFAGALAFEPRLALDGGADGLAAYRAIFAAAPACLAEAGVLLLEHGYDQRAALLELATARGFTPVALLEDLAGLPRVAALRAPP